MKNKKPVPATWYNEMVNELARTFMQAKVKPKIQQDRIDAVLASGLDYEVIELNNGHKRHIPLSQLYEFLEDAKKVDVDKLFNDWQNYKTTHYPVKGWKGDLRAAKIEAELKKTKNPKFSDANNYDFFNSLIHRYYLSDKQSEDLMAHFLKLNIL